MKALALAATLTVCAVPAVAQAPAAPAPAATDPAHAAAVEELKQKNAHDRDEIARYRDLALGYRASAAQFDRNVADLQAMVAAREIAIRSLKSQ